MRKHLQHKILKGFFVWSIGLAFAFVPAKSGIEHTASTANTSAEVLSEYKKNKYYKDATRLALRLKSTNKEYEELNAKVESDLVNSLYESLIAIHQSTLPEAKEVTQVHKLHTFPVPSVDRFFVVYKRNAPWATPFRLGDLSTDSEQINSWLEEYGLEIDRHMEWDDEHNSFNIHATKSLNIASVAKLFSTIEEIVKVDLLIPDGEGNDIEVAQSNDGWQFRYIIKFDNCITGCRKRHMWSFDVNQKKHVQFLEESGDALPDWMTGR